MLISPISSRPSVRFGLDPATIGNIIAALPGTQPAETNQPPRRNSRVKKNGFLQRVKWNTFLVLPMTVLCANLQPLATNLLHHQTKQPLESVLPKTAPTDSTIPPLELLKILKSNSAMLSPNTLLEAAKLGLVKEVWLLKSSDTEGTAILLDGTKVKTALDNATKDKLAYPYNVEIRAIPYQYLQIGWIPAGFAALIGTQVLLELLSMGSQLVTRRRIDDPLSDDDKNRIFTNDAGRLIVSLKLNVTDEPITPGDVEALQQVSWLDPQRHPTVLEELKKRLKVLLAGQLAEERLCNQGVSISALSSLEDASRIADLVYRKLPSALHPQYIPAEFSEAQKTELLKQATAMVTTAYEDAKKLLDTIPNERLIMMRDALKELRQLKKSEAQALLDGSTTLDDIKKSRRRLGLF